MPLTQRFLSLRLPRANPVTLGAAASILMSICKTAEASISITQLGIEIVWKHVGRGSEALLLLAAFIHDAIKASKQHHGTVGMCVIHSGFRCAMQAHMQH